MSDWDAVAVLTDETGDTSGFAAFAGAVAASVLADRARSVGNLDEDLGSGFADDHAGVWLGNCEKAHATTLLRKLVESWRGYAIPRQVRPKEDRYQ